MAAKTWVGRFSILHGQAQEEGPWLGSFIRQRPNDESDELFVLVEPALEGSEDFCEQLVQAIGRRYSEDTLSITGALQRSLRAAHDHLIDWNRRSLREHRVAAGASCLAVRGQVAYLAQAGPGLAYYFSQGRLQRLLPEDAAAEAIGIAEELQPQIGRFELAPGDLLLIATSGLDDLADEAAVEHILARGADEALPELYLLSRDQEHFMAVLLSCFEEGEQEPAGMPVPAAPEQAEEPAPVAEPPAPEETGEGDLGTEAVEAAKEKLAAAAARVDVSRPVVRLRGAQPSARGRYRRTTGVAPALRIPREIIAALIILLAIGLLAWCIIPGSVEESREDRFRELLDSAQADYAAALPAQDPSQTRALLEEAQADLEKAAAIHPDDGELNALRADVSAALAELDAVYELRDLALVAELGEQVTGSLSIDELAVGGLGAYMLDSAGGRVIALPLVTSEDQPFVVFQAGEPAGLARAARPLHVVWAPEMVSLLIMDEERQLFAYQPAENITVPLTIRGAQEWGSLDGLAYADGNLYVLDLASDQVWRYLPTEGGFDSERSGLLNGVDLEGTVSIAVSSQLFLLMEDGGVRRFEDGQERPFPLAGIDVALVSPASPVILPESGRLMVMDRGNKRLVLFSSDGDFLRQLTSPTLVDLRGVAVDWGTVYVLVADSLYKATLPP